MFGRLNFIKRLSHPRVYNVLTLDGTTLTFQLEVSAPAEKCACMLMYVLVVLDYSKFNADVEYTL